MVSVPDSLVGSSFVRLPTLLSRCSISRFQGSGTSSEFGPVQHRAPPADQTAVMVDSLTGSCLDEFQVRDLQLYADQRICADVRSELRSEQERIEIAGPVSQKASCQ